MNVFTIYNLISPWFRKRRFEWFAGVVAPGKDDRILDVGGFPGTWTAHPPLAKSIDVLNIQEIGYDGGAPKEYGISALVGNGCDLEMGDGSYDVLFSNSVIEHVGSFEDQKNFAKEALRVGKKLWVQTPARSFFMEPHYITPFIHWFPKSIQRRLIGKFTVWGWLNSPSQERVDQSVDEIRLLSLEEMEQLFPGCKIIREKFLWFFTKSYVAYRS